MRKDKQPEKNIEGLRQQLLAQVVETITQIQNDTTYLRSLGSKHVWESASDDIFDATEKAVVELVRNRQPLEEGDQTYDVIGELAWEAVTYLDKIAYHRLELDKFLKRKCAELVSGSERSRRRAERGARTHKTK